jgi:hypothetical protein
VIGFATSACNPPVVGSLVVEAVELQACITRAISRFGGDEPRLVGAARSSFDQREARPG